MEVPTNDLSFDTVKYYICYEFQVGDLTIMWGEKFIQSQTELDEMLAQNQSRYELLLYDAYDYSQS